MDEKIVAALIGMAAGSVISPIINYLLAKQREKRNAKLQKRPIIYEELIVFLISDQYSKENFENFKVRLLLYAKDDVIEKAIKVLEMKNEKKYDIAFYKLIIEIRTNLGMASDFKSDTIDRLIKLKHSS